MTPLSQLTYRNLLIAIHDGLATAVALVLGYYMRLESEPSESLSHLGDPGPLLFLIVPVFIALSVVVCYLCDLTTSKWRFVSIPDVFNILRVATILSLALVAFDYILVAPNVNGAFFFGKKSILLFWCIELLLLGGSRFAYRYFHYTRILRRTKADSSLTLLLGQTHDIDIFLRSIENGAVKRLWPVGLISFSRADRGSMIRNIPVLGAIDDIEDIVHDFAERGEPIARVLMAPSAFEVEAHPESIIMRIRRLGLAVNRLPSIDHDKNSHLTPIEVENLLLPQHEEIDAAPIAALIKGKAIVVTGGGGVIGAEICRRAVNFGAARLLIIENSEAALVDVIGKLASKATLIEGRLGDTRDIDRISRLMNDFKPDLIFHAAALRREPTFEADWSEVVRTNIFGLVNVADAAAGSGASTMVVISTAPDMQAPSAVKMTAEFVESFCVSLDQDVVRQSADDTPMRVVAVRIGDVLAPNGAIMTKLRVEIESGGPVTVAHPDMVRHFRTGAEGCDLLLAACAHAMASDRSRPGIYVLDPGQPVSIRDLATRMIRLSARQPGYDIDIVYTGLQEGEALDDRPIAVEKSSEVAAGISIFESKGAPMKLLREKVAVLERTVEANDPVSARMILEHAIPDLV